MASSTYGRKLNPYRRLRDPLGVKGVRQSVVVTNNPSSIDQNQQLLVRFPNLGAHDVVVADVVPKEQPVAKQQPMPAPGDPGDPVKADWTPWILLVGAGLAALCVWRSPLVKLTERQQKQQHPEARSSGASQPPPTPRCAQHLKVPDDPFYMAWCAIMSSTPTQKNIVNDLYHAAVVGGLAIGYAKLGQMVFKGPLPRLDLTPRDAGMVVLDLSAAMATKDMLIKQGLIPSDIVK